MEYPKRRTVTWIDGKTGYEVGSCEYIRADLVPQWQPIETAPKDGTDILVYDGFVVEVCHFENNVLIVSWSGDRFSRDNAINCDATHWMSLPEPPK